MFAKFIAAIRERVTVFRRRRTIRANIRRMSAKLPF